MNQRPALLSSKRVFDGRVFDVRIDQVRYADGQEQRVDVVAHGGSFTIVAMPAPGQLVLVRQYRQAVGTDLWELPAGRAEPGEDPLDAAARELREETGYRAGRLRPLGALYATPGFCDEIVHFFVAEQLEPGPQALDDDERIEVATFEWEAAWRAVAGSGVADCKTVAALLWMRSGLGEIGGRIGR